MARTIATIKESIKNIDEKMNFFNKKIEEQEEKINKINGTLAKYAGAIGVILIAFEIILRFIKV